MTPEFGALLGDLPRLRTLSLNGAAARPCLEGIQRLASHTTSLHTLSLSAGFLDEAGSESLAGIPTLRHFKVFSTGDPHCLCPVQDIVQGLARGTSSTSLWSLYLLPQLSTSLLVLARTVCSGLPSLRLLHLNPAPIGPKHSEGILHLLQEDRSGGFLLPHLETLTLQASHVSTVAQLRAVADAGERHPSLRSLDLGFMMKVSASTFQKVHPDDPLWQGNPCSF